MTSCLHLDFESLRNRRRNEAMCRFLTPRNSKIIHIIVLSHKLGGNLLFCNRQMDGFEKSQHFQIARDANIKKWLWVLSEKHGMDIKWRVCPYTYFLSTQIGKRIRALFSHTKGPLKILRVSLTDPLNQMGPLEKVEVIISSHLSGTR